MTGRAHLLLALMTIGVVGFVLNLVRSGRLRAKYAMLWTTVGAGLIVLAAYPRLLDRTSIEVGIVYPPAAFLMAAVAFLFVLTVHFSWELSRLEERTRTLAEEVALLRDEIAQQRALASTPEELDEASGAAANGSATASEPGIRGV